MSSFLQTILNGFAAGANPLEHVVPHPIKTIPGDLGFLSQGGQFTVLSDQIVIMILGTLLLITAFPFFARKRRGTEGIDAMVPSGFGALVEMVCEYWRKEVAEPHLGKHADKFIKFIWSVFFWVLTMNVLGLIPFGTIFPVLFEGVHIGGTPTSNIWVTGTLAVITMVLMVFNGLRYGGKAYLAHFIPGPIWMAPLMLPVEIAGLIAKVAALAIRLFANMIAGHVLLAVLLSMILMAGQALGTAAGLGLSLPLVAAIVAINLLELFVASLQAFIFTYLTVLFIGMSVNVHHDDEAHAH